jgi:hypothetical protein
MQRRSECGGRGIPGDGLVTATSQTKQVKRLPTVRGKQPFEDIVAIHGATVLRVCRAVLGPSDADDA